MRLLYRYLQYYNAMTGFSLLHWKHPILLRQSVLIEFKKKFVDFECHGVFTVRYGHSLLGYPIKTIIELTRLLV